MREVNTIRRARRRRGVSALEMLLVLPVLMAVLMAVVQLSMIAVASRQLEAASAQGARVAAQGGDRAEVERAVRRILGAGRLRDARIDALLTRPDGRPLPSGEMVEVTLRLPAGDVAPDLLAFIGFSIQGETLLASTRMMKE